MTQQSDLPEPLILEDSPIGSIVVDMPDADQTRDSFTWRVTLAVAGQPDIVTAVSMPKRFFPSQNTPLGVALAGIEYAISRIAAKARERGL